MLWDFTLTLPTNCLNGFNMKIDLYVSINSTSQDTFICEIDEERLEEIMLEYIERMHPELMPLDDDELIIVPEF